MVMLEESPLETRDDMVSLIMNKPVRSIRAAEMMNKLRVSMGKEEISVETGTFEEGEYEAALGQLAATKLYIYDHLGQNAMANILARIEYILLQQLNTPSISLEWFDIMLAPPRQHRRIQIQAHCLTVRVTFHPFRA